MILFIQESFSKLQFDIYILWFLCMIMTHRGSPYLLFLTVEAWGGGYVFL
jgi:hypothetical protein